MNTDFLFTSESVTEGHPDKIADQISDAILDEIIALDKNGRVACETLVTTGMAVIAGEITTSCYVEIPDIARQTIKEIGYNDSSMGFDWETCAVITSIDRQSTDIAQGVDGTGLLKEKGAGDQGLMFGYATNETPTLMPAPIIYSHLLLEKHAELRKNGQMDWARPDAKSQLTFRYENDKPVGIEAVVLSTQHSPDISLESLQEAIMELVIKPVLPAKWVNKDTQYHINPTGRFVIGGPMGDCGLTGRKIIVDTYGGAGRHGGGAFSGKDATKVDRSAAYACRYVAKNIVAAGLADRLEIQVSYAIGVAEPTAVSVETFGTEKIPVKKIEQIVRQEFDLRPYSIIRMLDLVRPIYRKTAAYGHFGREEPEFTWERTDKAAALRADAGL